MEESRARQRNATPAAPQPIEHRAEPARSDSRSAKKKPVHNNTQDWLSANERYIPWAIALVAGFTRYYRIDRPDGVAFDETHFGGFTAHLLSGNYYFDIHPPLAKLVFWLVGRVSDYDYRVCDYQGITKSYAPECGYWMLRATAAFFSTWTPPALYLCARLLGASPLGGILAAGLLIFDGLGVGEGRFVLMDSQLIFWLVVALLSALAWWERLNSAGDATRRLLRAEAAAEAAAGGGAATLASSSSSSLQRQEASLFPKPWLEGAAAVPARGSSGVASAARPPPSPPPFAWWDLTNRILRPPRTPMSNFERSLWCVWVGWTCGNAFSVKMTGLATPGIIGIESGLALWFLREPVAFVDCLKVLLTGLATYIFYFWCHFALLPYSGDGDVFMTPAFQATLVNSSYYRPDAVRFAEEGFLTTVWGLNRRMVIHNAAITEPHPWQANWFEWIFNLRGLLFYSLDVGHSYTNCVYLLGNPLVIWSVAASLGLSLGIVMLWQRYKHWCLHLAPGLNRYVSAATFCLTVYAINILPYLGVVRSTFIYHYMPALIYGELLAARTFEQLVPRRWLGRGVRVYLGLVVTVFLFYAPWIYAMPLTNDGHERRRWLPRWN